MSQKTVFLLGAGASVADVATRSLVSRPPLDREFFRIALKTRQRTRALTVRRYMRDTYGFDLTATDTDSLEGVMGLLYPDLFNPSLEDRALIAFRALLQLFTNRLADTTNDIEATTRRLFYRILSRYLADGRDPKNLTIVTFNQDLQVEKTLELLCKAKRWSSVSSQIFCFPGCYSFSTPWESITGPTASTSSTDLFPEHSDEPDCIRVLKLHGSLNWYSTHNSPAIGPKAMFNPSRRLYVTRRKEIATDMTLSRPTPTSGSRRRSRRVYTLPVVVPPVNHKSAVLHNSLNRVWRLAESRIESADDLVIFGYSCPALDYESSNLLRRAQRKRSDDATTAVIDPDGNAAKRFIDLLSPKRLDYFASAKAFIDAY